MTISIKQWKEIQQAIEDGRLKELLEHMLTEAYESGIQYGLEEANGLEEAKNEQ